jgi:hypothetical protein
MAQNPVDQLAVVRDSVHAESSEVGVVRNKGQLFEVVRVGNGPVGDAEQCKGQEEKEDFVEVFGLQMVVVFVVKWLRRTLCCQGRNSSLLVVRHLCSFEASMQHLPAKAEKIFEGSQ